jgi:anti-sigma factor RsiW
VKQEPDEYDLMFRYLLGELAEEEQSRLEQRYFTADELFEELLVVEGELIDGYALGEFSEHERRRIERHFLRSPDRRERLLFTGLLMRYSADYSSLKQSRRVRFKPASWWREFISFLFVRI